MGRRKRWGHLREMGREEAAIGGQHLPPASQFQIRCFPPLLKGSNWSQDLFKASACRNETLQETSPKQKLYSNKPISEKPWLGVSKQSLSVEQAVSALWVTPHRSCLLALCSLQPLLSRDGRGSQAHSGQGHWITCAQEECGSRTEGESAQREDTLSQRNLDKK